MEVVWATPNLEQLVVDMARVSTNLQGGEKEKLIRFLMRHRHWSPFEMVSICVKITTSRMVAQQILRHKSFSFQEFSQRYATVSTSEPIDLRCQSLKNRQGSDANLILENKEELGHKINQHIQSTFELYEELLENNVARECARNILPLCATTVMYMSGTVRSWIHYLQTRLNNDTQKEHEDLARLIYTQFHADYPIIFNYYNIECNFI